jgi:hypothetical protein
MEKMTPTRILFLTYLHPRQAMDALAELKTPHYGALYAFMRGLLLALLFYLPFYLLKFKPISPAFLQVFDTPDYFLYAALMWPLFGVLSWLYVSAASYLILRLLNYRVDFDRLLNLGGLLTLAIGIVIILFDWLMVAAGLHTSANFMGIAHLVIADPWSITLTSIFYKKYFGVPAWLSVLLGILTRLLYMPMALVFIRT